jgi:hypothetical protein
MSQERSAETGPAGLESWVPRTDGDRAAIRDQMERILSHPLFRNSKRYPTLFRYVVEHTLDGAGEALKERALGIEVFGRSADYDTSLDPVVRMTAGEVRKRIAQYYHEPGHSAEIRIDVPAGSYVPAFRLPAEPESHPATTPSVPRWGAREKAAAWLAVILAAGLAWWRPWSSPSALDRFWKPVLASSNPVLLCVGQPVPPQLAPGSAQASDDPYLPSAVATPSGPGGGATVRDLHWMASQNVALSDAVTLSRLAGLLQARGKPYRVQGEAATTFADLRGGPVVLIGAFNNDWTLRLTGQSRFSFERGPKADSFWIKDQHDPHGRQWAVDMTLPYLEVTEDYAIISRVLDPTTERMVVVAAGIANYGTLAAGEFLTVPGYMEALAREAPRGWEQKNIQIVVATKVIGGSSGPPRVLAAHFW